MDLDTHYERLVGIQNEIAPLRKRAKEIEGQYPYTAPFRPEMIAINLRLAPTFARVAFELVRLVPHGMELYRGNKERMAYLERNNAEEQEK